MTAFAACNYRKLMMKTRGFKILRAWTGANALSLFNTTPFATTPPLFDQPRVHCVQKRGR